MAASLAGHAAVISALVWARAEPPVAPEPPPVELALFPGLAPPNPDPGPSAPEVKAPTEPPPKRLARPIPTPPPPEVETLASSEEEFPADSVGELSEADLAGAMRAGSGPPGGSCDMARFLQAELRKDPLILAEVAEAHRAAGSTKAILLWNGQWIRRSGQIGRGLAAVRELIRWEVAFAPEACKTQAVRGLVLISLNDSPFAPRLVVGQDQWRWSDLVGPRRGG